MVMTFKYPVHGSISINHRFNVFLNKSGSGKTFLFRTLLPVCKQANISCLYVDIAKAGASIDDTIRSIRDSTSDIILLDDFDVIVSDDKRIKDVVLNSNIPTVIVLKSMSYFPELLMEDTAFLHFKDDKSLEVIELWTC